MPIMLHLLDHHLNYNHYPPITHPRAVDYATQAIEAVERGEEESVIIFIGGGYDEPVLAGEIVEAWHLQDFLELDNEDAGW